MPKLDVMDVLTLADSRAIVEAMANTIHQHRDELSALDAATGDGDHGINMDTALQTAVSEIKENEFSNPAQIFKKLGSVLTNKMGGASGIIFGSFFAAGSKAIKEKETLTQTDIVLFFEQGIDKVQKRGKAKRKDKTILDALMPALDVLPIGTTLAEAMQQAAQAAQAGAEETKNFVAQHGRAKYLGERSLGHQDAGATSMALMLQAWANVMQAS